MSETSAETATVVVERDFAAPAQKIWRALTQPELIAEWLMKNDFSPTVGHRFVLTSDWGSIDCKVVAIEPERRLAYSWSARGVETVVTFTLSPSGAGTHLRMEQAGFRPDQKQETAGARFGWGNFFGKLEEAVARMV